MTATMAPPSCPLAPAELRQHRDGHLWIVRRCPLCGRRHTHGGGGRGDDPRQFLGHRVAHCGGRGGYWLVAAPDADECPRKP